MPNRQIVYIGAIPQDTDMLNTNLFSYIGLAKLSAAVLGSTSLLNNFTCVQTGPPSLSVTVSAGEIYALENIDNNTYGSIPPDTTHAIVKQGVNLDITTLTCTAPSTVGNSVNYLVQIGFSETDTGSEVLPYYNASDPSQAWSGPNNDGTPNFTIRTDSCNVNLKQGVQAPTGTQVTPSPDSGFLGAFVITVAHGATTIINSNISVYSTSNFINETLTQKISQATADLRYAQITSVQNSQYVYGVDSSVSANTITANLSPALTSYIAGQTFLIKIANTNTGASTINLNSLGAKNIIFTNGGAIGAGDMVAGGIAIVSYDGTAFQLRNPATADFSASSIQNNSYIYGMDTGSANAYAVAPTPAVASYAAGLGLIVKVTNTNTTSSTLNVSSLGTKNIKLTNGSNPFAGDLVSGMEAWFVYDGTNFQLMNPATLGNNAASIQNQTYTYTTSSTSPNTYTATLSSAPASYTAGLGVCVKFTNANTNTTPTINLNSLGAKTITKKDGSALLVGDIASGMIAHLLYDGTNFQLNAVNESNYLTTANYQNNTPAYAVDSGSADTYAATLSPAIASYVAGLQITLKITNANTGTSTLNVNSLGTKSIVHDDGSALDPGDLYSGMVARFVYDGTNFQLVKRSVQQDYSRNLVIGGDFSVNPWQAGTSFSAPVTATYTADMWQWIYSGSGTVNITKSADAPSVAQCGLFTSYSLALAVATADASIGAADTYAFSYRIEGYDFAYIAQRPFTISFWIKATVTGTYCISVKNSGIDRSYVAEYVINSANTWEKKTITISASPSAGTWNYTNGIGLEIDFSLSAGSNFQTTPNTWQSSNYNATSNQVNAMGTNANVFKLSLVKIESGTIATQYAIESVADVLERCQRYFRMTWAQGTAIGTASLVGSFLWVSPAAMGNGGGFFGDREIKPMRTSPTVTVYSTADGATGNVRDNEGAANKAVTVGNINDNSYQLTNNSGGALTDAHTYTWHHILDARL